MNDSLAEVTIAELQDRADELVDRATTGERFVITRDGTPVVTLTPSPRPPLGVAALQERRRALPFLDPLFLRADIDGIIDPCTRPD